MEELKNIPTNKLVAELKSRGSNDVSQAVVELLSARAQDGDESCLKIIQQILNE